MISPLKISQKWSPVFTKSTQLIAQFYQFGTIAYFLLKNDKCMDGYVRITTWLQIILTRQLSMKMQSDNYYKLPFVLEDQYSLTLHSIHLEYSLNYHSLLLVAICWKWQFFGSSIIFNDSLTNFVGPTDFVVFNKF